jgi:TP901 family phage tail tape measure protein
MAAGNDTVNIKVKYIPDTSALKNIKEIRMPEIKIGGKDAGKGVFDSYNNAIRDLNRELSKGTDASAITKAFKTVGEETQKVRTQINSMKEAINQSFQSPSNQSLIKDYQGLEKQLKKLDAESQKRRKKSAELSSFKSQNNMSTPQARKEISKAEALVTAGEKLTKQDQERLEIARQIVAKEEELAKLRTQEEIRNAQKDIKNQMSDSKYDSMISSTEANRILGQYNDILSRVGINLNGVTGESKKFSSSLDEQVNQVKAAKKEVVKFGDIVSGTFLGTSLSNLFQTGLSRGIEFFKDYDEILTRTMMVTGQTREEVNSLTSSYNKLANQLSSTTKDVAAAQLVFYQQGLGTSEALKMTEASIAVSKTGGIGAAEAADRLTAAVRGYQLSANEAMGIADKMSALDAAAASSVDELTVAMQKSASQARMAGLDLDYYMAYLSTMQEVTREAPENIGTAMKSITSRLQEIKDIGKIEEDGTTFSNVAKALTSIGIAATDSSGQLRTLQDIMNELGPMWNTLDRNHKAYIATVLAGNRQQSRFIALMDNYDRAMELVDVSQNASGESAKQLRAYNQGLEASFTRLSNAWQQFATNIADSSMIKRIIDMFSSLVELLNKIPKGITSTVVPLLALTKVFTTLGKAGNLFKGFKTWSIEKLGLKDISNDIGLLGNSFQDVSKKANSAWNSIKKFIDGFGNTKYVKDMNQAIEENSEATDANRLKRLESESSKVSEQKSSTLLSSTENALTNSYNLLTESIKRNEEALQSNDDEILLEQNDAYKVAKSNLSWATANENQIKKQINDVQENFRLNKMRKLDEEKSLATSSKHGNSLIKQYLESTGMDTKGLRVSQQMFDDNYEDAKKWLRKKTNKEISELAEQAQADAMRLVEEAEDAKKRTAEIRKELAQIRKDSGYSYNKEDLPQKKNSTKFFDTFKEKETFSLGDVGKLFREDKNIGNFDKISALFNKISISSGLVAGSLTQMGASFLGLDDDMSSALSTGIGLATTFSKFAPPWGAIIGASIGAVKFVFDKLWPSVETTQKKLTELQQKMDEFSQKKNSIESNLAVYEELSTKLDKTDEETQKLKDSTEELVKLVPGAIIGYNQYGEAILNTAAAYEELDKKQREMSANADKQLDQFNNLQKGAQKTERTLNVIWKVIGVIATGAATIFGSPVAGAAVGAGFFGTSLAWDSKISKEQIEENKKVWDENYSEILKAYQIKRDDFIQEIQDVNKDTASQVADTMISGLMEAGRSGYVSDATKEINNLIEQFKKIDWNEIDSAKTHLETSLQYDEKTFGAAREQIDKEIRQELKDSGLEDIEIDTIITAVLNISYKGAAQAESIKKQIDAQIKDLEKDGLTDEEAVKKKQLEDMKAGIDNLTQSELELLSSSGLLKTEFSSLFSSAGGIDKILEKYKEENGELNKNKAIVGTINDLLGEKAELLEKINSLNGKDTSAQQAYNDKLRKLAKQDVNKMSFNSEDERSEYEEERYQYYKSMAEEDPTNLDRFNRKRNTYPLTLEEKGKIEEARKAFAEYNSTVQQNKDKIKELETETKSYSDTLNELIPLIETAKEPTFGEMSSAISEIQSTFENIVSLVDSLQDSNNLFSFGDVGDLFSILDTFEKTVDLTNSASLGAQNYYDALGKINDAVQYQNGQLIAQEGLEEGLYQLAIASAVAKAEEFAIQLEQTEQELEYQNVILEAEKTAINAALEELQSKKENVDVAGTLNDVELKLEKNLAEASVKTEEAKLNARLSAASQFAAQYAKIMREAENGTYEGGTSKVEVDLKNLRDQLSQSIKDSVLSDVDMKDVDGSIQRLQNRLNSLDDQINKNNDRIKTTIDLKKKVSDYLKDPHAFGNNAQVEGMKKASDSQKDYNEKLERTLTLLEKIEGLQHKIDENETFKDLYKDYSGEDYGRLMMTNLDLAQQQYDVYKDLFKMQQEMTNQAAGDLLDSPYGQMFKIQENGDIGWADLTMYDKYKSMPADMKEDIDNLVEAFQKQRDALRDTENNMSKYAQEVKKVREELVQMQIEIENELVDAIKNREKILHDARVKALDDEIDMIEKAVEARKKAQEDDNSSKELYKAQEALRRATLDSSGKNNAQLLQLQQDLEDKQLEIAEKRFEDDMDDRKQWLQDTKDAETETYEYRLEKMTWYWEQVQAIQEAGTEAMMETLIHWNIEYAQTSEYQQGEMERKWKETMDAMKAATDMGAELGKMTSDIVSVTQTVEAMDIKIQALPGSWQKATEAANSYARAANAAWSAGNYYNNLKNTKEDPKPKDDKKDKVTKPDASKEVWGPSDVGRRYIVGDIHAKTYEEKRGQLTEFKGYTNRGSQLPKTVTIKDKKKFNGKEYVKVRNTVGKDVWMLPSNLVGSAYASGGYVDYTGPAWVDGNKTHPEAFLSAYQTEQIGALAKSLDPSTVNNATTNSNVTFGSINFNVASMSSVADGKKALDIFVQGANDMMAKKGIGTKLNINMK